MMVWNRSDENSYADFSLQRLEEAGTGTLNEYENCLEKE